MKNTYAFLFCTFIYSFAMAQNIKPIYDTLRDKENGALVYKGKFTLNNIYTEPEFDWMRKGVLVYQPNSTVIGDVKRNTANYKMIVFMGTWCDDSQNMIPKLYKVLQQADIPLENIEIYGVDRAKTTGLSIEKTYNVTLVPTIILFDNDKEIGRITESVQLSVEWDLANIALKYMKK